MDWKYYQYHLVQQVDYCLVKKVNLRYRWTNTNFVERHSKGAEKRYVFWWSIEENIHMVIWFIKLKASLYVVFLTKMLLKEKNVFQKKRHKEHFINNELNVNFVAGFFCKRDVDLRPTVAPWAAPTFFAELNL